MRCAALVLTLLPYAACTAPADAPAVLEAAAPTQVTASWVADDGSYLTRIDPLGGQWKI